MEEINKTTTNYSAPIKTKKSFARAAFILGIIPSACFGLVVLLDKLGLNILDIQDYLSGQLAVIFMGGFILFVLYIFPAMAVIAIILGIIALIKKEHKILSVAGILLAILFLLIISGVFSTHSDSLPPPPCC